MRLIEQIYNKFKAGAIERNIDFTLTIEQLIGLLYGQNFKCRYTKTPFIVVEEKKKIVINTYNLIDCLDLEVARYTTKFKYNCSIDRINNKKPYTIDNVFFCTKEANMKKKDYDLKEFVEFCKLVANNYEE